MLVISWKDTYSYSLTILFGLFIFLLLHYKFLLYSRYSLSLIWNFCKIFFHFGGSLTLSCLLTYESFIYIYIYEYVYIFYMYIWSINKLAFCLLYYSSFCYHMEESFAKDHKNNLLKNLFIRVISQFGKYNWYLTISWIPSTMSDTW